MFGKPEVPRWQILLRLLADASTALGRLSGALDRTPLHQAWLWREMAGAACRIAQISGHRIRSDLLMQSLAGAPCPVDEDGLGLAAARRIFLMAAPLFRAGRGTDSSGGQPELFSPLWGGGGASDAGSFRPGGGAGREKAPATDRDRLALMVRALAEAAGQGSRPALLDLLLELRRCGVSRHLPPGLVRLALPLAVQRAGLIPKAVPALLGGRLPLTASRSPAEGEGVTPWLARGLAALAREAAGAERRLSALTERHGAWHARLAEARIRAHARLPAVLDLLAATPVLSASLVSRHLGCTPQGAGEMLRRLADLGVLTTATTRSRWKIYLAGDLPLPARGEGRRETPLAFSSPFPGIDRDAIETTLDALLSDLDQANGRAAASLAAAGR